MPEDTEALSEASSKCAAFHDAWNDRLPTEVAAAKVVNPDGHRRLGGRRGRLPSYGYSAEITPELRRVVA